MGGGIKKPMSDAAKARLREAAEKRKGRDTLMGLDRVLGLVAFDYVQEERGGPLAEVKIYHSGDVGIRESGRSAFSVVTSELETFRIGRYVLRAERKTDPVINYVHLGRCPEWIEQEFANRWGARKVATHKFRGPGKGHEWQTVTVVPIVQALAWFRFLWPEPKQWCSRVEKYMNGYTDGWLGTYPGVGSRVHITQFRNAAVDVTAEICGITTNGTPCVAHNEVRETLSYVTDKWTVIG